MIGILAQRLLQLHAKKVLVLVPSAVLCAYQQLNYCPEACQGLQSLQDPQAKAVFYLSFEQLMSPHFQVAGSDFVALIDEADQLLFDVKAAVKGTGKLISVVQ